MNNQEVITHLKSLRAESEYMSKSNPDNEVWERDIIALNRAITAVEKRRINIRKLNQLFIFITIIAAFFLIYIKVYTICLGKISAGQALVFSIPALVYIIIAADTYKKLGNGD